MASMNLFVSWLQKNALRFFPSLSLLFVSRDLGRSELVSQRWYSGGFFVSDVDGLRAAHSPLGVRNSLSQVVGRDIFLPTNCWSNVPR